MTFMWCCREGGRGQGQEDFVQSQSDKIIVRLGIAIFAPRAVWCCCVWISFDFCTVVEDIGVVALVDDAVVAACSSQA